jgi:hypothetical protein
MSRQRRGQTPNLAAAEQSRDELVIYRDWAPNEMKGLSGPLPVQPPLNRQRTEPAYPVFAGFCATNVRSVGVLLRPLHPICCGVPTRRWPWIEPAGLHRRLLVGGFAPVPPADSLQDSTLGVRIDRRIRHH